MKKIKCDWFGEGEELYFNIMRLAEFEKAIGRPIQRLFIEGFFLDDLFIAYEIGLRHEGRRKPQFYINKIQELMYSKDLSIGELITPVQKALIASGVAGKQAYYGMFPEELTDDEKDELEAEESAKN